MTRYSSDPPAGNPAGQRQPRRWMTADWGVRRPVLLQRVGEWSWRTRLHLGMTMQQLSAQSYKDGENLSEGAITRTEKMRLAPARGGTSENRRLVSWSYVAYLAALDGQDLSTVEAYLRTGDLTALNPSLATRAETVRVAFLSLTPARQDALEDFAQFLHQLDQEEQGLAEPLAGSGEASTSQDGAAPGSMSARALVEMRDARDAAVTTARTLEAQETPESAKQPPSVRGRQRRAK